MQNPPIHCITPDGHNHGKCTQVLQITVSTAVASHSCKNQWFCGLLFVFCPEYLQISSGRNYCESPPAKSANRYHCCTSEFALPRPSPRPHVHGMWCHRHVCHVSMVWAPAAHLSDDVWVCAVVCQCQGPIHLHMVVCGMKQHHTQQQSIHGCT